MGQFTGNWIDSIGNIVPGYRGYKDKEMRRDSDRLLRNSISKLLTDRKPALDTVIADLLKSGKLEHMDRLSQIKRKLDNAAVRIRTAPAGYSGFFDTVQVRAEDLDRLYRFDMNLHEKAAEIAGLVDGARIAKDPAGAGGAIVAALEAFEALIGERDTVIAEVR